MELCMSSTNIPDGHVVSFRMGETRRQALVEKLRKTPVRFPTDPESIAEPVLIEVMKVVASTQLVLQKGLGDYSVYLAGAGSESDGVFDMSMHVQGLHGDVDGQGTGDAVAQGGGDRDQDAAGPAKAYLDETGVMQYFQSLLQAIVRDRPQDPYAFMLQQLHARTQLWVYRPENGLAVAIRRTPQIGCEEAVDASGYQMRPGERFRVAEAREGEGGVLFLRLADGRGWLFDHKPGVGRMCERVHEEGPGGEAPSQEGSASPAIASELERACAVLGGAPRGAPRDAPREGPPREGCGEPPGAPGAAEAAPPAESAGSGSDRRARGPGDSNCLVASGPRQELRQSLQQELRQGLRQVCVGGDLQRAFDEVMGAAPGGEEAPPQAAPEVEAGAKDDNRQNMRVALEEACGSGQQQAAFRESGDSAAARPEDARARVANGLREVTAGGDAGGAEPQDAPAVAADGLREAAAEGGQAAPEGAPAPHGQEAGAGAPGGAEQAAPQGSWAHGGRGDAVKSRVRGMLEEHCSDGTLDSMFMEAMGAAERQLEAGRGPLPAEPAAPDPPSPAPHDMGVVQRELQGMRNDNKALREQINLMMQKMEELRLENESLNDRLDGNVLD